ncbi:hypothetical protein [Novipirellula sp.]
MSKSVSINWSTIAASVGQLVENRNSGLPSSSTWIAGRFVP